MRSNDSLDAGPLFDPRKALGSLAIGLALLAAMWAEYQIVMWAIDRLAHAMGAAR